MFKKSLRLSAALLLGTLLARNPAPINSASSESPQAWYVEPVAASAPQQMTSEGLKIDSYELPHVAYAAGGAIRLARHDGNVWQQSVVESSSVITSAWVSLALGPAEQPHLVYARGDALVHATRIGGAWMTQTIASGALFHPSIAVDASGQPHISYVAADATHFGTELIYARKVGNTWISQVVDQGKIGEYSSLALDSGGRPHIAYTTGEINCPAHCVQYARWTGVTWQVETVQSSPYANVSYFQHPPQLKIGNQDQPHISFVERVFAAVSGDSVRYATKYWGSWAVETVIRDSSVSGTAIAVDAFNATAHFCYRNSNGNLHYAYAVPIGGTWIHRWVAELVSNDAKNCSIDSVIGYGRIAFTSDGLYFARRQPGPTLIKEASPSFNVTLGDVVTYSLTLSGLPSHTLQLVDILPSSVSVITASVPAAAIYSPTLHAVIWNGTGTLGSSTTFAFQVVITGTGNPSETHPLILNTAWLTDTQFSVATSASAIVNPLRVYFPLTMR